MDSGSLGDSIDLVVVGADWGKGKRTGVFGSFLLASYNKEDGTYQTVTKVATGFSDLDLDLYTKLFMPLITEGPPENLKFKAKNVDVWFKPSEIFEVRCADITLSPNYTASIN